MDMQKEEMEFAKKLIAFIKDFNEKSFGLTPLIVAIRFHKVDIIKLLLPQIYRLKLKKFCSFKICRSVTSYCGLSDF